MAKTIKTSVLSVYDENGGKTEIPAIKGKNAYEYAVEGGYTGTEKGFCAMLAKPAFLTPQMFGAVGDGITDDSSAIQAALDAGGVVFFPNGRYKVTQTLTAYKPCTVRMAGAYPSAYSESGYEGYTYPMGDYPTGSEYNDFGARLETYASGIGLEVGESVRIDGLNLRAMEGFNGTLFKYNGSKGTRSYPSHTRLEHINLSNDKATVVVDTMFDFSPYGNYGVIVNDVTVGSNHCRQYASYGFKSVPDQWANSVRLCNINVETFAKYPFYICGKTLHNGNILYAGNWVLKNICLQAFPQKSYDSAEYVHENVLYLEGMTGTYITGCKIWDVETATVSGDVVKTVDLQNTTAIGNDTFINALDLLLTKRFEKANELNLTNLSVSVAPNAEATGTVVTLKDGSDRTKAFTVPSAVLTEEQIGTAVGNWMAENSAPTEQIGKNKLDPDACYDGDVNANYGHEQESIYAWVSGYIGCTYGDEIRVYETVTTASTSDKTYRQRTLTTVYEFDENKGYIGAVTAFSDNVYTPSAETVAYFRVQFNGKNGSYPTLYEDRSACMVTVNTTDSTLEDYKVELVGGIGEYLVLSSPNGTRYTLSVDDNGLLSAVKA